MVLAAAIDWSAKYAALHAWTSGASGWTTVWADQNVPRPDFPYVLLDVIASAKEGGVSEVTRTVDLTRARDVKVTPTVQNNATYTVTINGTAAVYVSDADATLSEITAGLVAAVGGIAEPVSASDNGTDVDIVGDGEALNPSTPQLFTVTVSSNLAWSNNDAGNEVATRTSDSIAFTLNVQAFHRSSTGDNQAADPGRNAYNLLTTLQASLGLPSVQAALRAADIAVIEEQPITDMSDEVDDAILSRASMDVRMRTLSTLTAYTGYIQTVSGATTFGGSKDSPINDTIAVET